MEMANQVAVVTGGASGLGESCVRAMVKQGMKVAILDLDQEKGNALCSELQSSTIFCRTDVSNEDSVRSTMDQVISSFGNIHVAINCAGIGPAEKIISKKGLMPLAHFARVVDINLIGTFNVLKFAAEKMINNVPNEDQERGVIINTASIAAFEGQIGQTAYGASKAAIVGLTLPAARELAEYGIRVLSIVPGIFDTPLALGLPDKVRDSLTALIPFPRRFGKPEEFAMLAMHIIENPFLNGTNIRLDASLRMASK